MLILGEPGSGKTTMLLELTEQLLAEAQADEALRIPVVFNLSSWAVKQPPLTEWLVSELQTLYLIPKKVAQAWVEQDDILPLLDGLDEVAQEHRAACIKAINAYREAQGTPLVVCSRIADYEAIGEKLLLSDALILRPLTQDQINEYLEAGGSALNWMREALRQDETLQEMAQSPLLLSIMALAYSDQPPEQFTTNLDDRHRQLFATYIQRQLTQRQKDPTEDSATTVHQLTYLAHQMTQRQQTIFLIERLQPNWFLTPKQQRLYRWTVILASGLSPGLVFGLVVGMIGGLDVGLFVGLVGVLGGGLFIELLYRLDSGSGGIYPIEKVNWSRQIIAQRVMVNVMARRLVIWLVFGLVIGLIGDRPGPGLIVGLVGGLFYNFSLGLIVGLVSELVESKTTPNEGIKNSAKNAIRIGLATGLSTGLVFGISVGLFGAVFFGLSVGLVTGLNVGLSIWLIGGLIFGLAIGGGLPVIQHYTLRFWLYRYGYLPLKLVPFLDLAAERLILQKVGGGYRFVHRLLQDYLASLYMGEGEEN